MFRNNFIKNKNAGLTLVELMVVISIFMVITGIAIFNYKNFDSSVSLQNLTDDIALAIRKAQSFAIGARGVDSGVTIDFNKSYGVHFTANPSPNGSLSGSDKSFLMFSVGSNEAKKYVDNSSLNSVCGTDNNCVELFTILTVDKIKEIRAYVGDELISSNNPTSSIDIIFTRPEPRASLCYRASSNAGSDCVPSVSSVSIIVSNGRDAQGEVEKTKTISVQNTGQISIQ